MPLTTGTDDDDDYNERYRPRIPSRVTSRAAIESLASSVATSSGRASGRLDALKGELHCIRDRFRDVKIDDMKEQMEKERMEREEQERSRNQSRGDPLKTYFDQYKRQTYPPPATSAPQKGAKVPAKKQAEAPKPADHKIQAKEYFERTRRVYNADCEEEEARAYFEEKRKMADPAWRMQQMLDSTPHANWQQEMREFQAEKAALEKKKRSKKAAPVTGYLLPWGAPKPVAVRTASPPRVYDGQALPAGSASLASPSYSDSTGHAFVGVRQMEPVSLKVPGRDCKEGMLPVSFGPGSFSDSTFGAATSAESTGSAGSTGSTKPRRSAGFGTTQSFEPLSPRWSDAEDFNPRAFLPSSAVKKGDSALTQSTLMSAASAPVSRPMGLTQTSSARAPPGPEARGVPEETPLSFPSSKLFTASAEPYVLTPLAVGPAPKAGTVQPSAKISYLNSVEEWPPSVLNMGFSGSSLMESETDQRQHAADFTSGIEDDDDDDFDDSALVSIMSGSTVSDSSAAGWGAAKGATKSAVQQDLVAPPLSTERSASSFGVSASLGGKSSAWVKNPGAGKTTTGSNGFTGSSREAPGTPSPPMALSILGPGKGIQELML